VWLAWGVRVDGSRMHVVKPPCTEPISQARLRAPFEKRIEDHGGMSMMRGFGVFRLCGVDGGVGVRDGVSFSILRLMMGKKGYA
jgi:hypothetical protein